jgi:hypothetical protein
MLRRLFTRTLFGLLVIGLAPSALAVRDQEVFRDRYKSSGLPRFGASTVVLNALGVHTWNELVDRNFNDHVKFLTKEYAENPAVRPELDKRYIELKEDHEVLKLPEDPKEPNRKGLYDREFIRDIIKNAKTLYDILNVTQGAKTSQIEYAYNVMAEAARNAGDTESLVQIMRAYTTLKESHTRFIYDTSLSDKVRDPNYEQLLLTEGDIPPRYLLRLKGKALTMADKTYIKSKLFAKEFANNRIMEAGGNIGFVAGALIQLCGKALVTSDPSMLRVCTDDQFDLNNLFSIYAFTLGSNIANTGLRFAGNWVDVRPRYAGHLGMPLGSVTSHYYDKFWSSKERKIFWDNIVEVGYEDWALHISNRDKVAADLQDATYNFIQAGYDKNPNSPEAIQATAELEKLRQAFWARDKEIDPYRKAWHENLAKAYYVTKHTNPEELKEMGQSMARMFATVGTMELFSVVADGVMSKVLLANQDNLMASMQTRAQKEAEAKFLAAHKNEIDALMKSQKGLTKELAQSKVLLDHQSEIGTVFSDKVATLLELQRKMDEANRVIEQYPELKARAIALEDNVTKNLANEDFKAAKDFIKGNFKIGNQAAEDIERGILKDAQVQLIGDTIMGLPAKMLPENLALPLDKWLMQPAAKVAALPSRIRKFFLLEDVIDTDLTFGMKVKMKVGQFGATIYNGIPGAIKFLTIDQIYTRAQTQAMTSTELEGKIKAPLTALAAQAKQFTVAGYPEQAMKTFTDTLEEYDNVWNEYRTKVVLGQFNEHFTYFQKLEEKSTMDAYKKIMYVQWIKGGEHEDDDAFVKNGKEDPAAPKPPWHSDPYFKDTFEKEKEHYRSLVTDWRDDELTTKLNGWRTGSDTNWSRLRKSAVNYLAPMMHNAYFDAEKIPVLTLPIVHVSIGDHFATDVRDTWFFGKDLYNDVKGIFSDGPKPEYQRIPLPTNMEAAYIEQINILETICSEVARSIPQTDLVVNLGAICERGTSNSEELISFMQAPEVTQNPYLLQLKAGGIDTIIGERPRADLVAIAMASSLAGAAAEIANLHTAYDNFTGAQPEPHLPTPAQESERTTKLVSKILDSKKKDCASVLKTGTW